MTPPDQICSVCNKVFERSYNLKVHMRRHTGDKPYACEKYECGKWFGYKASLDAHYRAHERQQNRDEKERIAREAKSSPMSVASSSLSQMDATPSVQPNSNSNTRTETDMFISGNSSRTRQPSTPKGAELRPNPSQNLLSADIKMSTPKKLIPFLVNEPSASEKKGDNNEQVETFMEVKPLDSDQFTFDCDEKPCLIENKAPPLKESVQTSQDELSVAPFYEEARRMQLSDQFELEHQTPSETRSNSAIVRIGTLVWDEMDFQDDSDVSTLLKETNAGLRKENENPDVKDFDFNG
mmetsp:Transcript_1828/g.5521  ORF Transcript_1828/g.5521 Transcript_1828/m.5521 type:complete len:295 (-) Transcript_1828:379-1263(-)|eukprot:CAMPEP_0198725536 /NCGR_PEP_ID=MMETSP1475-20131203/2829_1 /TAXON_ID= ORGANISM="Unidentified sp., Strain CCMP1999" /NCGR_SAMPLE_ID=MMETSP1475 /ASSEMBLY_ACC=CAM_ASM_001111 /LENGTH=294 /DNA_ID=CAMNT_0044487331 /DNA_START=473 /DNA_END=1357 /DNA_ORIENTATION=-